jgi:hypothetical protein
VLLALRCVGEGATLSCESGVNQFLTAFDQYLTSI